MADTGDLILALESDLVVQVQLRRPDLLFLHAAVLEKGNVCHLLTGHSGAGKSTTCWGLLCRGFGYLSDEMAPIDIDAMTVLPYPHALCLKSAPPPGFEVPEMTRRTSRGYHLPTSRFDFVHTGDSLPLRSIFFVEYDASRTRTDVSEAEGAEAATRLYPNTLNALAHDNAALPAVAAIAAHCRAWSLRFSSLDDVLDTIERLVA